MGAESVPRSRKGPGPQGRNPGSRGTAPCRRGHERGGSRMNQPLTIPLFLPHVASEQSQSTTWRTVRTVLKGGPGWSRLTAMRAARRSAGPAETTGSGSASLAVTSAPTAPAVPASPPGPAPPAATGPAPGDGGAAGPPGSGTPLSPEAKSRAVWAIVVTGLALFMASLDNLVVSTALPVIRVHLHAGLSGLEWTVNAYTLTFAVLLLSAAAIGERFGRRRIFVLGITIFTAASAVAALAPSIGVLVAARAVQGAGGAMIMPLSLTLLSAAVSPERRNAALGIWGAIGGVAVAIGPLVGGAITTGWAWQYIFWINVPVGVALGILAWWKLAESRGNAPRLDLRGVVLVSVGLFGVVYGLVQANSHGWTSTGVLSAFAFG